MVAGFFRGFLGILWCFMGVPEVFQRVSVGFSILRVFQELSGGIREYHGCSTQGFSGPGFQGHSTGYNPNIT